MRTKFDNSVDNFTVCDWRYFYFSIRVLSNLLKNIFHNVSLSKDEEQWILNSSLESWKKIFRFMIQFKESFKKVNDTKKAIVSFLSKVFLPIATVHICHIATNKKCPWILFWLTQKVLLQLSLIGIHWLNPL